MVKPNRMTTSFYPLILWRMNSVADLSELAAEGEYKFLPLSETLSYVLLAIRENQPCNGAEVQRAVLALSDGHVAPAAGNLYPMLARLVDDGLIARDDRDNDGWYHQRKIRISADLNGGGPPIRVITTNGGVHISTPGSEKE